VGGSSLAFSALMAVPHNDIAMGALPIILACHLSPYSVL